MKVCFIGAGNVAWHLAPLLARGGAEIIQIYSRNLTHAREIAAQLPSAQPIDDFHLLRPDADLYLLAIPDDAIADTASQLPDFKGIWAHTSGSVGIEALTGKSRRGVLYPLQSFSRGLSADKLTPPAFFIEGDEADCANELKQLAQSISAHVYLADGPLRARLHLAAVFACNFTDLMWIKAWSLLSSSDIDPSVLQPLVETTIDKAMTSGPINALTGPARRRDLNTVTTEAQMLSEDPRWQQAYELLSSIIVSDYSK